MTDHAHPEEQKTNVPSLAWLGRVRRRARARGRAAETTRKLTYLQARVRLQVLDLGEALRAHRAASPKQDDSNIHRAPHLRRTGDVACPEPAAQSGSTSQVRDERRRRASRTL